MRTAFFFFLSVAVHLAAFAYPVSLRESDGERVLPLTIVTLREEVDSRPSERLSPQRQARTLPLNLPAPQRPPAPATTRLKSPQLPVAVATIAPRTDVPQSGGTLFEPSTPRQATPPPVVQAEVKGNERANSNSPEEFSDPEESAIDNQEVSRFTTARYEKTPKPKYPEAARRAGKEGRVLLRVLVDEEGRSKTIEVNRSSGTLALDQAAADAMKHWRFYPARLNDRPVESWVRIPVDFLLENSKD